MSDPGQQAGLLASVRRLLATALEMAQVRLELLGTEIELEKQRLLGGLFWAALALQMLTIALLLLCGFIALLFWDGHRLAAVGSLMLIFLCVGVVMLRQSVKRLRAGSAIFATSASELALDRHQPEKPAQHATR
jgi:uncharacterized membrane protein YqjE